MNKLYRYKVYRGGVYVGLLPKVTSEFAYSQDINTSGTEIKVKLAGTLDTAGATSTTDGLVDESGNPIVDENGNQILAGVTYAFTGIPIDLGNRVVVWAYYDNASNGIQVFDGKITDWSADSKDATIELTVQSRSLLELDNYPIIVPAGTVVVSQTQRAFFNVVYASAPDTSFDYILASTESFQVPSDTIVSALNVRVVKPTSYTGEPPIARLTIRQGLPNDVTSVLIASTTRTLTTDSSDSRFYAFSFSDSFSLAAGVTYSATVTCDSPLPASVWVGYKDSDVYASGTHYTQNAFTGWNTFAAEDMGFEVVAGDGNVVIPFNSTDPSLMLKQILEYYQQLGGAVVYDDTTVDLTYTTTSYTFRTNTVYEGIRKILELSPSNWYWYVDPATNTLHLHRQASAAAHTFYVGKHIQNIVLKQTLDNLKNTVYFTGGNVSAGVNLFKQYTNQASTGRYGMFLDRQTDNRVTVADTAATMSNSIIDQYSAPLYETTVTIPAGVYDIETISLGQMVNFRNVNTYVQTLLMQIVGMTRHRDYVNLRLATNPPSVAHRIEDIRRNLDAVYTLDNPDAVT